MVSFSTEPYLIFCIFMKKDLVKRKRLTEVGLTNKKNPEHIKKSSRKNTKIPNPFELFLVIQNLKYSPAN